MGTQASAGLDERYIFHIFHFILFYYIFLDHSERIYAWGSVHDNVMMVEVV